MLSWLAVNGTAAIVEFPGVLYRGGAEQKIRKYLVDNNYVDTVIQLPPDLFFGTTIATCIIVLKKTQGRQQDAVHRRVQRSSSARATRTSSPRRTSRRSSTRSRRAPTSTTSRRWSRTARSPRTATTSRSRPTSRPRTPARPSTSRRSTPRSRGSSRGRPSCGRRSTRSSPTSKAARREPHRRPDRASFARTAWSSDARRARRRSSSGSDLEVDCADYGRGIRYVDSRLLDRATTGRRSRRRSPTSTAVSCPASPSRRRDHRRRLATTSTCVQAVRCSTSEVCQYMKMLIVRTVDAEVTSRYLFHVGASQTQEHAHRARAKHPASRTVLAKLRIPVPPLEVQREIVRVLDAFTSWSGAGSGAGSAPAAVRATTVSHSSTFPRRMTYAVADRWVRSAKFIDVQARFTKRRRRRRSGSRSTTVEIHARRRAGDAYDLTRCVMSSHRACDSSPRR